MEFPPYLRAMQRRFHVAIVGIRGAAVKWQARRRGALVFAVVLLALNAGGVAAYSWLTQEQYPVRSRWPFLVAVALGNFTALAVTVWALRSLLGFVAWEESGMARMNRDRQSLELQVRELSRSSRELILFGELSEMLQACADIPELCRITTAFAKELFPKDSGALYVMRPDQALLESLVSWGHPPAAAPFPPEDCWSIRRGKAHFWAGARDGLFCAHIAEPLPAFSFCLPLTGQGGTSAVLHLRSGPTGTLVSESRRQMAAAFGYQIAIGLSNLKLKQSLREEAIRDPLTGLFNRRFMRESLEHELQRARRSKHSLGLIAFDLDHFKSVNDILGHAAGDSVLQGLAAMAKQSLRAGDLSCRQGGDEFLLILPELSESDCLRLAEKLRARADEFMLEKFPSMSGVATLSCGVAMFPTDGSAADSLLKAADLALYQAKHGGRNRVFAASALPGNGAPRQLGMPVPAAEPLALPPAGAPS